MRCPAFQATTSCMHLCPRLCYYREFEPSRQLQGLRRRAAAHPLRPQLNGWSARLALTKKPPHYWCTIVHDSSGAVLGPPEQAWNVAMGAALEHPSRKESAPSPHVDFGHHSGLPPRGADGHGHNDLSELGAFTNATREDGHVNASQPLRSPFGLLEELLQGYPWQLLVACILLNRTGRAVVDAVLGPLFRRWPTPAALLEDSENSGLEQLVAPLGLQRRRSRMLLRFSREYLQAIAADGEPLPLKRLRGLHGMGKYSCDAYQLFVVGAVENVEPTDVYLGWFLESRRIASTLAGMHAVSQLPSPLSTQSRRSSCTNSLAAGVS